jgi:hypothetical protein
LIIFIYYNNSIDIKNISLLGGGGGSCGGGGGGGGDIGKCIINNVNNFIKEHVSPFNYKYYDFITENCVDIKDNIIQYAENILGLSATHPATDAEGNIILDRVVQPEGTLQTAIVYSANYCPASKRLSNITDVGDDLEKLVNAVQTHKCGNYC